MRYFDCHADTLTEIAVGESLWENTCDIDLKRVNEFAEKYTQIFDIWINRTKMDPEHPEIEFMKAYERAAGLLRAEEAQNRLVWCKTGADMERAHTEGKIAAFLSIEDISTMGNAIEHIYDLGARFAMLTWNFENEYAWGAAANQSKGLTMRGKEMAKELLRQGLVLDISHLSDQGVEDLFGVTDAPIIASHSNVREIHDRPRNLKKEYIQELIRRNGLIGMNFYREFVGEQPTMTDLLRHMDAVLELGGEDILALGGDFDGSHGQFPTGICGVESIPALKEEMEKAGFGEKLIEKILFENAEQFVRKNLR